MKAGLGVTASWWSKYSAEMRALANRAQDASDEIEAARIRRLALDAQYGPELAEIIALAAKPIRISRSTSSPRRPPDPVVEQQLADLAEEVRAFRARPRTATKRPRRLIEFSSGRGWRGWRVVREEVLEQREREAAERQANLARTRRPAPRSYDEKRGWLIVRPQTREVLLADGRPCSDIRLDASGNLVRARRHARMTIRTRRR